MDVKKTQLMMEAQPGTPAKDLESFLAQYVVSLAVLEGPSRGDLYLIEDERTVLGRGSQSDLILPDDSISREHAVLEFAGDRYVLQDLESSNGTFVNEKRVKSAELEHGDRIRVGHLLLQFLVEERSGPRRTMAIEIDD
jgi:pSer/pThr/pTyr-binding forkhead associated (FHA) protein